MYMSSLKVRQRVFISSKTEIDKGEREKGGEKERTETEEKWKEKACIKAIGKNIK